MRGGITIAAVLAAIAGILTGTLGVLWALKDYLWFIVLMGVIILPVLDAAYTGNISPVYIFTKGIEYVFTLPEQLQNVKTPLMIDLTRFLNQLPLIGSFAIWGINVARRVFFVMIFVSFFMAVFPK